MKINCSESTELDIKMPEKNANIWGYVVTGISSVGGMLGFQRLIIGMQNKKVKEMCDEVKADIAKCLLEERHKSLCTIASYELREHITEEFKVFKKEILEAINGGK